MSNTVKIRTRLHLPEAKVGSVLEVTPERAARLVNAKYAVYVDNSEPTDVVLAEPVAPGPDSTPGDMVTELPAQTDLKAEWVKAAEGLGIDVYDEDGNEKTKAVLIEEVTAAVAE